MVGFDNIEDKSYTIAEYLELEKVSEFKHEYHGGKIVERTGGTLNHGIICGNIFLALNETIKNNKKPCLPLSSEVRLFIDKAGSFVYPDAMVVCGPLEADENDKSAIINPILIVEVLSKSTGHYDRGEKFHNYCSLPSFKEYVLIDQDKPVVDTLYKADEKYWRMVTTIGLDKQIELHSIGCTISLEAIYRNIQDLQAPQIRLDL